MLEEVAQFARRVARGVDVLLNGIKLLIDYAFVVRGAFRLKCGREPICSTQELCDRTLAWTGINAYPVAHVACFGIGMRMALAALDRGRELFDRFGATKT